MRILMLGWEYPPRISGGLGTACHGLVHALAARGVDLCFVLPRTCGAEEGGGAEIRSVSEVSLQSSGAQTVPAYRELALPSSLTPYLTAASYPAGGARRAEASRPAQASGLRGGYGCDLQSEVQRYAEAVLASTAGEHFDLVHAHDWMTYPAGLALQRAHGKPLLSHVHACEYDRAQATPDARIVAVEQAAFRAAERVVCVSRYTAQMLHRRYEFAASKLRVVHNGVAPEQEALALRAGRAMPEPIVLFLGRLTHQKGPFIYLEAAARVLAQEPNVKFVVSGQGELLAELVQRSAELGLGRALHFTGFLEGPEVERMYALADIYVMPSVSEPFGLTPLEASRQGAAVILSRQSGVSEVLKSALRVDHWDVDGLARRILLLVRQKDLRERLARGAKRELPRLSWRAAAEQFVQIYEELAA